jgi:cyclin A
VDELVDETMLTRGGCTRDELLAAEVAVLMALRYELGSPTACTFLEHFMDRLGLDVNGGDGGDSAAAELTSRLADLSLLDYGILRFRPSVVAASAILVARTTASPSDDNPWGREHERATGYTAAELEECAERLSRLHRSKEILLQQFPFQLRVELASSRQPAKLQGVSARGPYLARCLLLEIRAQR